MALVGRTWRKCCLGLSGGMLKKGRNLFSGKMFMNAITSKRELDMLIDRDTQVLALFCASWCPFCQSFFVAFDREAAKLSFDSVVRVYIDDYDNPLWEEYSIEAVPTVILFEHEVSQRLDGRLGYGLTAKQFEAWLAKLHVTR